MTVSADATADTIAATPLHWKCVDLPARGSTVRATWLDTTGTTMRTRTATIRIATVSLGGDVLEISDGEITARLNARRLTDQWRTITEASGEPEQPEIAPVREPASAHPTTLVEMQRRWITVSTQLTEAEELAKALKAEKRQLNDQIVDEVVELGLDGPLSVDGLTFSFVPTYFTVYQSNEDGEKFGAADVIPVLKELGIATGIVAESYNGNTLKAFLRELQESGEGIPDELAKLISIESMPVVHATTAAARRRAGAKTARASRAQ